MVDKIESRDAMKFAAWYVSYMEDDQGKALIYCLINKIKQQYDLIDRIKGESELTMEPVELHASTVVSSINSMIDHQPNVKYRSGHYEWYVEGKQYGR